ncbi:hypothetical protein BD413DRAFT_466299, partial [Trametes elegans]
PKRKSDVLEPVIDLTVVEAEPPCRGCCAAPWLPAKKARKSDVREGSSSASAKKANSADAPRDWRDMRLNGEEEVRMPMWAPADRSTYSDDCNDIQRKIHELRKTPGFNITHWLREINSNSYQRFTSGPTGGASNGTYYVAYVYFEKVRIAQGKEKPAKRIRNEREHPAGFPREERRR